MMSQRTRARVVEGSRRNAWSPRPLLSRREGTPIVMSGIDLVIAIIVGAGLVIVVGGGAGVAKPV